MGARWRAVLAAWMFLASFHVDAASAGSPAIYEEACPEERRAGPHQPLPVSHRLDEGKVALGRRLFRDPRLSRDGQVSCASCHVVAEGGDDGLPRSVGIGGAVGARNAPSVLNRSFDFRLFWDGRAADLVEQIDGPLENPVEMDSNWALVIERLRQDAEFLAQYRASYGTSVTADALRDAIATYEMSLITPNAPFDRYLCGEEEALSEAAREGYRLFLDYGCVACHQGRNVGGNMFQRFGVFDRAGRADGAEPDTGRFQVTGREEDRFVFRVPSLRNVALTAPYLHDGSAADLETAVEIMARTQLGRELSSADVASLIAFLESLTGEIPPSELR